MKKILIILLAVGLLSSCADSKVININGEDITVEPYGWMDEQEFKNDSVIYRVNTGNVIWSIVGVETIVIPVVLTGKYLYEPVGKK